MPSKPDLNNSLKVESKEQSHVIPPVKAKLLEGKRGLIVGIANENSIAWGCAKAFRACPSSNGLGQSELFRDGGSGSFGLEFRRLSTDVAIVAV